MIVFFLGALLFFITPYECAFPQHFDKYYTVYELGNSQQRTLNWVSESKGMARSKNVRKDHSETEDAFAYQKVILTKYFQNETQYINCKISENPSDYLALSILEHMEASVSSDLGVEDCPILCGEEDNEEKCHRWEVSLSNSNDYMDYYTYEENGYPNCITFHERVAVMRFLTFKTEFDEETELDIGVDPETCSKTDFVFTSNLN